MTILCPTFSPHMRQMHNTSHIIAQRVHPVGLYSSCYFVDFSPVLQLNFKVSVRSIQCTVDTVYCLRAVVFYRD